MLTEREAVLMLAITVLLIGAGLLYVIQEQRCRWCEHCRRVREDAAQKRRDEEAAQRERFETLWYGSRPPEKPQDARKPSETPNSSSVRKNRGDHDH